ncbi:DUF6884 domain-containing protein [Vibrio breoganii]|uniref:DUF6884 domain-containing protein n=1 Tax=Vibrio breoganii TaxID=553239 RepID=UPI0021C2D74A|nr:DUF6884 domain-containing protein [Vibrio breoganii]MDN3716557.1 hypothetical protein [Vibrio breoganii]
MTKIHLLVPCTARKSQSTHPTMDMCQYNNNDLDYALRQWEHIFEKSESDERVLAQDLYVGQAYSKLKQLAHRDNLALDILSAGYGLISGTERLPSYNATFASNINHVPRPNHEWWSSVTHSKLPGRSLEDVFEENQQDFYILAVSNAYLGAIEYDLLNTLERFMDARNRIAIISTSIPKKLQQFGQCFVQCSRNVLKYAPSASVGLSLTDRNITAIATHLFVEKLELTKPDFNATIRGLNKEFSLVRSNTIEKRTKRSDEFIISYIEDKLFKQGKAPPSINSAFKQYKTDGHACQDKRFATLYKRIKSQKGLS